jgi:alpha-2-macroglobulin
VHTRLRGLAESVDRRPMIKAVVPVLVLVLVATVLATNAPAQPTSTTSPGSPVAGASPTSGASPTTGPDGSPAPTETPEPWEDLVLGPIQVIASLTPLRESRTGVDPSSRFKLRSLGGTPAVELAKGVDAFPTIQFRIHEGGSRDVAFLEPLAPLDEGTTYRFRLTGRDGSLGGSWAFQTQAPLYVVHTLPDDRSTDVPVNTGIEVTFDQDGVGDIAGHFSIEPQVAGRFELHGRTWAFVPDERLDHSTAYRVTVSAGVQLTGSNQVLEDGVTFRFETEPPQGPREMRVDFASAMTGVRPAVEPSLLIQRHSRRDGIDTLPVRIYRLPDMRTTIEAARRLTGTNSWLRASDAGLVPTDGLDRVATVDATLRHALYQTLVLDIPVRLDRGAYLVVIPRRTGDAQTILQVGTLAAYATTTDTRTVVWVNDLAGPTPVVGATVSRADGRRLASTGTNGLAEFETPPDLKPVPQDDNEWWWSPDARLLSVESPDGRWIVAALGSEVSWLEGGADRSFSQAAEPSERWWLLLNTDRQEYRQTDTINIWGRASSRDDGSPARSVELRLRPSRGDADTDLARIPVDLTRGGTFAASIPITALPRAGYRVDLLIGGRRATSTSIYVGEIVKPSYRFEVQTERHAYLDGDPVAVTVQATFYDGTAVPSLELNVKTTGVPGTTITTDADGVARITVEARFTHDQPSGWDGQPISVTPARPEEGEIRASTHVIVFPSEAWLTAKSSLSGTTLSLEGRLDVIDFPGMNAAYTPDGWRWPTYQDITGGPLGNHAVSVTVTRVQHVRRQVGTSYDFIEKKVTPEYRWRTIRTPIGTFDLETAADGRYHLSVAVPSATDRYDIRIHSTDAVGRPIVDGTSVSETRTPGPASGPSFLVRGGCGSTTGYMSVGLDERFELTMHDGDGRVASEGRFLWLVTNRGLRDLAVGSRPSFSGIARTSDLPRFTVRGVQVTKAGYVAADAHVAFDLKDLRIHVQLTGDRERYAPGGRATVDIRTIGPDGRPIAADVVVQGIDEKLYDIGAARDVNVLSELHGWVSSGLLQSFSSHRVPYRLEQGGCGATGGGGSDIRDDFGDVVLFDLVRTDADGRATVSFDLLDDLTSWRLSAMAVTADHRAGTGSTLLPVGLPFFVEAVLAPEYLVGDVPVLRVRAYGDALDAGDAVTFTVTSPSLGLEASSARGVAFAAARIGLPMLPVGTHRLRISAEGPGGRSDAILKTIRVVPSRLETLIKHYEMLTPSFVPQGGEGLTTYTVTDAGRGALIPMLMDLASTQSARFDALAAADAARQLLIDAFGFEENALPTVAFNPASFERNGIALLPYAARDPELTALAALTVPERINVDSVRSYLRKHSDANRTTREGRIMALAGLAGLGEPILAELHSMALDDLTIREWLWLALGLAAAGDENGARDIERRLLDQHGQRLGPWVRLKVGETVDDIHVAGRLLLVLSARLGEDFARDVAAYLHHEGSFERLIALEQLAYLQATLERLPRTKTRFAWTLDGERHVVALDHGRSFSIVLTAEQRVGFSLERLDGKLAVVTSWSGPGPLPSGSEASIERVVSPITGVTEATLVRVTITVTFDAQAPDGCWQITDLAPSGLAPIEREYAWPGGGSWSNSPWSIEGQRVSWCAYPERPDRPDPDRTFSYLARVVTPGAYTWEQALIQSDAAPEVGFATGQFTFTIE